LRAGSKTNSWSSAIQRSSPSAAMTTCQAFAGSVSRSMIAAAWKVP